MRCHQHDIEDLQTSTMNVFEFHAEEEWLSFCEDHCPSDFGMVEVSVFKKDIIPARETLSDGGRWTCEIGQLPAHLLDNLWFHLVQGLIGGEFDELNKERGCCGTSLHCSASHLKFAIWIEEYCRHFVPSVGTSFYKFMIGFGFGGSVFFEDFRTPIRASHTVPDHEGNDGNDADCLHLRGVARNYEWEAAEQGRDTGQQKTGRVCIVEVALPGSHAQEVCQLVLKNSFIHLIAPVDQPLPAPMLHRMRTV
jgi:hypothetical protein